MKKTYILTTIVLFAVAVAGCKKGFLSQEVNPNTPSVATPQTILASALNSIAGTVNTGFTTQGNWLGYYAPSGNFVASSTTETYTFTNASFSLFGLYSNITNFTYLVNQGTANPAFAKFQAIGMIMNAFDYQMLVDDYSDVPYSQAENSVKYLFPAYDKGPDIYLDLMAKIDAAIALINANTSATSPGTSDIMFGGNMTNWKKFANTLKLRIAIRQSNLTAVKGALVTELAKTTGEGYLDDGTFAMVNPGYSNSDANGGQQSPYYGTYGYSAAGAERGGHQTTRANSFFINFMVAHGNDSVRLKQIWAPTLLKTEPAGKTPPNQLDRIVGNQFGNSSVYLSNTNTSALGPGILIGPAMSATIISGSEACYLLSEAILEGYLPGTVTGPAAGTAQDYYQRGIVANFVALGVGGSAAAAKTAAITYYSQPVADVNWVASAAAPAPTGLAAGETNLLRAIMTQKYIALFGYGIYEMYNEYRRTALPDLLGARSVRAGTLGTGSAPNRIYFPQSETQVNAAAVAAEPAVNPFSQTSLIFWARNIQP